MTYLITNEGPIQTIELSYLDEDVGLTKTRKFSGSHEAAEAYVPTMDADIRESFAHLFPVPEIETEEVEE